MVPPVVGHSLEWFNNSTDKQKQATSERTARVASSPFSTVQKNSVEPHFPPPLVSTKFIRLTDTG